MNLGVEGCPALADLDGLAGHATPINAVTLLGNGSLTSVEALGTLPGLSVLRADNNPALPQCQLDDIAMLFSIPCHCSGNDASPCP